VSSLLSKLLNEAWQGKLKVTSAFYATAYTSSQTSDQKHCEPCAAEFMWLQTCD